MNTTDQTPLNTQKPLFFRIHRSKSSTAWAIVSLIATALVTVVSTVSIQAIGDQLASTDNVPMLIPYNGTLSVDGQPLTTTDEWIRFELLDNSPAEGEALNQVVYSQSIQVDVHDGKFTALLGPFDDNGASLQGITMNADRYLLQTTMLGNHNPESPESSAGDDVTLSNPQRLLMSPYALMTKGATDFHVAGDFIFNNLSAGVIDIGGTLSTSGPFENIHVIDAGTAHTGSLTMAVDRYSAEEWYPTILPQLGPFRTKAAFDNVEYHEARSGSVGNASNPDDDVTSCYGGSENCNWAPVGSSNRLDWDSETICFLQKTKFQAGYVGGSATPEAQALKAGYSVGCRVSPNLHAGRRERTNNALASARTECASLCFSW